MNSRETDPPTRIRPAAVAGRFYPDDAEELRDEVAVELKKGSDPSQPSDRVRPLFQPAERCPKAIIVPHAGYRYSGPVAGSGYAILLPFRRSIKRVVLLGPSHRVGFKGLAVSSAEAFATPLGLIPIDRPSVERILHLPQVCELDEAHANEHSLEVHLPFLQIVLDDFVLVPIVVGSAEPADVAEVIETYGAATRRCSSSVPI